MKPLNQFLFTIVLLLTVLNESIASTGETYGYGSKACSLGNAMQSASDHAFSAFYNPSMMSLNEGFNISLGAQYAKPTFHEIENIVVGNFPTSADLQERTGNVDLNYLSHFGQVLGATLNLGEKWKFLTIGFVGFLPIERTAYLDTGEPFKPEYFTYRSKTQRPQIYVSMSANPFSTFFIGAGAALATNLSANATMTISTADNSVSHSRFSSTVKTSASAYIGLYYKNDYVLPGLVFRLPSKSEVNIDTQANTRLLGSTAGVAFMFNSASTIYYDPLQIEFSLSKNITDQDWVTAEVDWLNYSRFESPTLSVMNTGTANMKNSVPSTPVMKNIMVPKVAYEHSFESLKARIGYLWRPTPVSDNSGAGNLVDPEKHLFTVGVGLDLEKLNITKRQILLDLHAQYHHLVTKHITKSSGTELGDSSQNKVGAPGYDIGGRIIAGGLSVSLSF